MAVVERRNQQSSMRFSVLTRGAVLGGAGLALGLTGIWRVDGAMASMGLVVWVLLGLCALLARWNASAVEVVLQCPERVEAGVVFPMRVVLANRHRWLDAFGVRVELDLAGKTRCGGWASWIATGSQADLDLRVAIPGRMIAHRHRLRLVSDVPFGFFEVVRNLELEARIVVVPKPVIPRGMMFSAGPMELHDVDPSTAAEGPGEPRGLRQWRPGDSQKRTHWPATVRSLARGAGLVVLETDPPGFRPARFVVVVHSFGADGGLIQPDRFEKALSFAAGTLRLLHAQGMPARLIADFDDWTSRPAAKSPQLAACMEILARARRSAGTEAHDLQAALQEIRDDEGLVILSDMPLSAWRGALPKHARRAFTPELPGRRKPREVRA